METLTRLLKRAGKFSCKEVAGKSGLSRAYITELIKGDKNNPSFAAVAKIEKAVTRLEAAAAKKAGKTEPRKKTAKKQTPSRDTDKRSVANDPK